MGLFVLDAIPTVQSPKVGTEKEEQEFFLHVATINCLWTLVLALPFFFSPFLGCFLFIKFGWVSSSIVSGEWVMK